MTIVDVDSLSKESPLIGWLITKLPILAKSIVLALIITLLAMRLKIVTKNPVKLSVPIFIIMTIIVSHAPKMLDGLEHGLGFAIAVLLLGEASPFFNSLRKMKV